MACKQEKDGTKARKQFDRDGRKKAIEPKNRLLKGIDPSASVEAMFKSQSMLKTRAIHNKQDSTLDLAEVTKSHCVCRCRD